MTSIKSKFESESTLKEYILFRSLLNRTLDHTERSLRQGINILPIFKLG